VQVWAGVVPLAGFLIAHVVLQASALWGPLAYARVAGFERSPVMMGATVVLIYVPLVVHAALGIARVSRPAEGDAARFWAGPLGRPLQQLSAAVLLIFVAVHIGDFPYRRWTGEIVASDYYPELCARLSSTSWGGVPLVAIGYLVGVAAAALHGAHGLYHAGLSLGVIEAERGRRWAGACAALGVGLFGLGALIVIDLATG
jgi:succinate dehydrogenase / fumarate reductase cytochrome b subunit